MFSNFLKEWVGKSIGVVDKVDAGGDVVFPGLTRPLSIADCEIIAISAANASEADPVLAKFKAGSMAINEGLNYCALGVAGAQGADPEANSGDRLPPWDPDDPGVVRIYADFVRNLPAKLVSAHPGENLDTLLQKRRRLEGTAGFFAGGEIYWDKVQILRVKNALQVPVDGSRDWIVYKFSWLPGNQLSAQEGGGHGPPDRK